MARWGGDENPGGRPFQCVADQYDQVLPFVASFARQARPVLSLPPDAQVLDLAAGRGAFSREPAGGLTLRRSATHAPARRP